MGRKVTILALLFLCSIALIAQPATTTVADQFYTGVGPLYCSGTFTLTWATFYSMDGYLIQGGTSQPIPVSGTGTFSVNVVPTNINTTPASGIYTVKYSLQPTNCAPATESWNVPSSMTSVKLTAVRTVPSPPPSLIPITSLQPPTTSGTYCLGYSTYVQWLSSCGGGESGVTSVGLNMPAVFNVAGSPVTSAGSFTVTWANESANLVFAGPSTGSAAAPTFRSLIAADLPTFGSAAAGIVPASGGGTTNYLRADGSWAAPGGGGGGVASVGLAMPGIFTVSGSPVTGTGTLTATTNTQSANLVWAGPSSGSASAPTFRSLVGADLPAPGASSLGGIESLASVSHKWINAISTLGVPSATQPACVDLSDSATGCSAAALPPNGSAGGDLSGTYPNPGVAKVNGGAIPASQACVGTNSGSQFIAATCGSGATPTLTTVSYSSTPTFTRTSALQEWTITLTGNVSSSSFSGLTTGDQLIFEICQDSTGGRSFVWPTSVHGGMVIDANDSSILSTCSVQSFFFDGTYVRATTPGIPNQ